MIRLSTLLSAYLACLLLQVPVTGGLLRSFGSAVYGALDVAFFGTVSLLVLRRGKLPTLSPAGKALAALFAYAALSAAWSASLDVSYGIALLARDFLRFLNVVAAAALLPLSDLKKATVGAVSAGAVLYPLLAIPTMSFASDFQGSEGRLMYAGYKDANSVGRDLAVILMLYYWALGARLIRPSLVTRANLVLLAALFLLVFSKTTTVALVTALAFGVYFYKSSVARKLKGAVLAVSLVAAILLLRLDYVIHYATQVQAGSALQSLSGRTFVWDVVLENFGASAFLGFGINSFGAFAGRSLENIPQQAHNELLQIAFSYGVPGVLILAWFWFSFYTGHRRAERVDGRLIAAATAFYLVSGLTEANIVTIAAPIWLVTLISYLPRPTPTPALQPPAVTATPAGRRRATRLSVRWRQ